MVVDTVIALCRLFAFLHGSVVDNYVVKRPAECEGQDAVACRRYDEEHGIGRR